MDNSLMINTYIRQILCSDSEIAEILKDNKTDNIKIFPVISRAGTSLPYVILTRDSVTPEYTKDGCYENEVYIVILVVHNNYDAGAYLANKIRNKLDLCRYNVDDVYIDRIELSGCGEGIAADIDGYVQELRFKINIENIG